jgi:DNA-binding response OmpR family regulator
MQQDGRSLRILLVEDSPTQAMKLQRILQERNFEVVLAANGQHGLDLFYQSRFDLVLSDVVMPEMNGFELCRRIKGDPDSAHVPVVLLTSLCEEADRQRGLQSGADEYLSKPYDAKGLLKRIAGLIERLEGNDADGKA